MLQQCYEVLLKALSRVAQEMLPMLSSNIWHQDSIYRNYSTGLLCKTQVNQECSTVALYVITTECQKLMAETI